jgi:aspartyl-tRNA(Asn)/glutamyl-tRNA(Gln) amidotransferase subunit B
LAAVSNPKSLINWLSGPLRAILNDSQISITEFKVPPLKLAALINLVEDKKINQQSALQQLLPALQLNNTADVSALAAKMNLLIVENTDELAGFADQVLEKFKPQVQAYRNGKKGVLGLFVGEIMKLSQGKADPQKINAILLEKLS